MGSIMLHQMCDPVRQRLISLVLCDVVSQVGSEERDAQAIGLVKQEILADLTQFDGGDGKISQKDSTNCGSAHPLQLPNRKNQKSKTC